MNRSMSYLPKFFLKDILNNIIIRLFENSYNLKNVDRK